MFETFRRWRDSRGALAELERMQAREGAAFGFLVEEKLAESLNALGRGDRARASQLWDEALAAAPAVAKRAPEAIHVLLGLDRAEEAETMMLDGQRRFPAEPSFAAGHAYVAAHRGDHEEALRRWEAMRARFPRAPEGFRQGAEALNRLGRPDDAERLLGEAVSTLPGDLLLFIAHAQVAARRQDWPAALSRWKLVERFGHPSSISGQAEALRHLGRIDEAEEMLGRARFAHPLEPDLALEYARTADSRGDSAEAARRWADAIKRFPLLHYVYREAAESRLRAGDQAGAEAVLAEARERFEAAGEPPPPETPEAAPDQPDELGRLQAEARAAFERGDPDGEAVVGAEIGRRFPGDRSGLFHHARGLRNAERIAETELLLADAPTRFGDDIALLSIWTSLPRSSGDMDEALRRARWLLERFPDEPSPYTHLARCLIGAGRAEEARGVAEDGLRRWPRDIGLNDSKSEAASALSASAADRARDAAHAAVHQGYAALHGRALEEAERRFADVRALLPTEPAGWLGGAETLREQRRPGEATALLEAGMAVLPDEPRLALAHAELPAVQFLGEARDWDAALARTAAARERFPNFEPCFALAVRLLRDAGRAEDADAAAEDAVRRFPDSSDMLIEHARAAAARGDFELAAGRFGHVRARFPDYWPGYAGLVEALCRLGRFDEAEAEARGAVDRFPDEPMVLAEAAHVAARRNDPAEALRRWQTARSRFPDVSWLAHRLFEAQLRLAETETEAESLRTSPEPPREASLADILLDFESLGGTHLGCEFGLVQRAAGVEPLGLLRWTDMAYDDLVRLLEAGFEGVGLPENTELIVPEHDGRAEYTTRDRRFNMRMHTFVARDDAPPDRMHAQLCRRLRFLRDKLVADLRAGSKIFVFRQTTRNLESVEIDRLHAALRAYGPAVLFYVRYAGPEHPHGTVTAPRDGLLLGALDRFAMGPNAEPCGEQNEAWNGLCRAAHTMWRPLQAQAAA